MISHVDQRVVMGVATAGALVLGCAGGHPSGARDVASLTAGTDLVDPLSIPIPPLADIDVPEPRRFELDNGMIVFLLEDREFPMIEVRLLTAGGSAWDPRPIVGLAEMTAEVMRTGGTERFPGDELDLALENTGTTLNVSAGERTFVTSLSTLTENLDGGLDMLSDVVRHPSFPDEKIELAKSQERTAIASRNDEALDIAFRELATVVYGSDSPYGWHTEYATIAAIDAGAMAMMHETFFHPNTTMLVAWGDFQSDEMLGRIRETFGDWARSDIEVPDPPAVPTDAPAGLFHAEKPDVTNSVILIGDIGIRRDDPDYAAAMVLQEALGGGFSSRIFGEIRTRRGLAYSAGSAVQAPLSRPGIVAGYVMTQVDSTVTTLRLLVHEFERIRDAPITGDELDRAKDALLNAFVFQFESRGELALRRARFEFFGYPPDFLAGYQDAVAAVTAADVQRVAQRLLRPESWKILVVGPGEDFAEPLSAFAPVTPVDITIPPPPATASIPTPTSASRAAGRALLDAVIEAYGGSARIDGIRDVTQVSSGVARVQGMELQIGLKSVLDLAGRRLYNEQSVMGQVSKQIVVGDEGWMVSPMGSQDLPAEDAASQWTDELADGSVYLFQHAEEVDVQALDPADVDGATCDVLHVVSTGEDLVRFYIHPETRRIVHIVQQGKDPMTQAPAELSVDVVDWTVVDGVVFPTETNMFVNGEPFFSMTTSEIDVNAGVDDALFAR